MFYRTKQAGVSLLMDGIRVVLNELYVWFQVVKYDLFASTIPGVVFMLATWKAHSSSPTKLLELFVWGVPYFFLYIFTFCLSNQLNGVEEDRLNKPDRPLVRGLITRRGAQVRWVVAMLLFALLGWWVDVLVWALLWEGVIIFHNFLGWSKHWFTKNLAMFLGTVAQLAAAWQIVTPLTPTGWRWVLTLAVGVFLLVGLQDLRDVAGDKVVKRKTLPIVFGPKPVRLFLSAGFTLQAVVTHFALFRPAGNGPVFLLCSAGLAILNLVIAARAVLYRSPQADHQTYMMYNYWYCFALASAFVVLS